MVRHFSGVRAAIVGLTALATTLVISGSGSAAPQRAAAIPDGQKATVVAPLDTNRVSVHLDGAPQDEHVNVQLVGLWIADKSDTYCGGLHGWILAKQKLPAGTRVVLRRDAASGTASNGDQVLYVEKNGQDVGKLFTYLGAANVAGSFDRRAVYRTARAHAVESAYGLWAECRTNFYQPIDADTFENGGLGGYDTLLGADAPDPGGCGYAFAKKQFTHFAGTSGEVYETRDVVQEKNKKGERLRYVRKGTRDIGLSMIWVGAARSLGPSYLSFARRADYQAAMKSAKIHHRGLWATSCWNGI